MIVVRRTKDGSPRYRVRYETPLGREVGKTFSRRAEAEAWERKVKDAGSFGIGLPAPRSARTRTVTELWVDVLATRGGRWESRTRARYIELFRLHVQPHFGRAKAAAITARDVRLWVQLLIARGMAPATAAKCVSVLSAVMTDAIEKGLRSDNPSLGVRPRAGAPEHQRALTAAEVAALLLTCPAADRFLYLLAVTTGLRFGELAGLDVGDADLAGQVLHVRRVVVELPEVGQEVKPYPKGGATSRRTIGMSASVVQALAQQVSGRRSDEPLWRNVDGGRQWYSTAYRLLSAAYLGAGIRGASGFHTLRRTAATLALQQGASIRDVQAMLGHKSPVMTLTRYAQPDVEQQRAAAGRVADSILGADTPGQNPAKHTNPTDTPTEAESEKRV